MPRPAGCRHRSPSGSRTAVPANRVGSEAKRSRLWPDDARWCAETLTPGYAIESRLAMRRLAWNDDQKIWPMGLMLLVVMLAVPCRTSLAAEPAPAELRRPDFARYAVTERFRGTPAVPDLASAKDARRFRTVLRDGARKGPNFAGSFTIVSWGCGTSCQSHAI